MIQCWRIGLVIVRVVAVAVFIINYALDWDRTGLNRKNNRWRNVVKNFFWSFLARNFWRLKKIWFLWLHQITLITIQTFNNEQDEWMKERKKEETLWFQFLVDFKKKWKMKEGRRKKKGNSWVVQENFFKKNKKT